jgi:hypothetical protein
MKGWFNTTGGYYVYHLSDDYRVLYVGYTDNPGRRLNQHRKDKPWFKDVTRVDISRYATKHEALKEEATGIMFGEDLYNIQLNSRIAHQAFVDAYDGVRYEVLEQYVNIPVVRF